MRIYIYLLRRSQQVARQSLCQSLLLDNVSSLMMMFAGLSCDMRSQFELLARPARYLLQVSNEDRQSLSCQDNVWWARGKWGNVNLLIRKEILTLKCFVLMFQNKTSRYVDIFYQKSEDQLWNTKQNSTIVCDKVDQRTNTTIVTQHHMHHSSSLLTMDIWTSRWTQTPW